MLGKLAYLTWFKQGHHSICERHENSPAEISDFLDIGLICHSHNVAQWFSLVCCLADAERLSTIIRTQAKK